AEESAGDRRCVPLPPARYAGVAGGLALVAASSRCSPADTESAEAEAKDPGRVSGVACGRSGKCARVLRVGGLTLGGPVDAGPVDPLSRSGFYDPPLGPAPPLT